MTGTFLRQLNLGQGIDTERIEANYTNGVLRVMIPVSERAKPRKIEVTLANEDQETLQVSESGATNA